MNDLHIKHESYVPIERLEKTEKELEKRLQQIKKASEFAQRYAGHWQMQMARPFRKLVNILKI